MSSEKNRREETDRQNREEKRREKDIQDREKRKISKIEKRERYPRHKPDVQTRCPNQIFRPDIQTIIQ
jgi:hypothetical protein